MSDTGQTLKRMIANFAVLEQMVIDLTRLVTSEYDRPDEVRAALLMDVRARFDPALAEPDERGRAELLHLANEQLDRLEPRVLGPIDDAVKQ